MDRFQALRVAGEQGAERGNLVTIGLDDLDAGNILIKTAHSGINYKDALAVTGSAPIMRRFPCVAGIEVTGTVSVSEDARFPVGTPVMVHGFGLGVAHDGGFSEFVRVPSDWVMPIPAGMSLLDASVMGVAGYTAALAIHEMERHGLAPDKGPIVVTGATGGVASLGIAMLATAGYRVTAITGKAEATDYLLALGAERVLPRSAIDSSGKPLSKAQWAGALDSVGGEVMGWLTATMQEGGTIASFGNAGGHAFSGSVLPFILRGIQLLGINANSPMPLRQEVWKRIAGDLRPRELNGVARVVGLDDVMNICEQQIRGAFHGRAVVAI